MTGRFSLFALLVGSLAVSGCGGHTTSTPALPSVAGPQTGGGATAVQSLALSGTGTAQFVIQVPASASTTQSLTIQANTATPVVQNVSSTSPGCVTGMVLTCTVNVPAPSGTVLFTIKTYSAANGTGTLLESGTLHQAIASGVTTTVNVILGGGTVVKLALTLKTASPRECDPAVRIPLYATGKDSAGNVIIGPYSNAMTLTDSDTSGTTTLTTTALTASNTAAALNYNGHLLPSAKISATGGGLISGNVTPAKLAPQQMLYVRGGSGIDVFPLTANGATVTPARSLTDSNAVIVNASQSGIVLGQSCVLYVYSYTVDSSNNINWGIFEFPAGGNGTVAPIGSITGSNTGLSQNPSATNDMKLDSLGRLYVLTEYLDPSSNTYFPAVLTFAAGASGNVSPIANIHGFNTMMQSPVGLALDKSGNVYVPDAASVFVYAAGSTGDVAPIRTISGSNTQLGGNNPVGPIAIDSTGRLYVGIAGSSQNTIAVAFAANASGNASPVETIATATEWGAGGIGFDYKDNVYVSDRYGGSNRTGSMVSYAAHGSGSVSATRTAFGWSNAWYPHSVTL